mmetsp:Transcript_11014/g.34911  ORF Transcript_11014/g.34911 Transcript_11014/m.34911 type:complete len:297 (+) Transcript_11014:275-1165(+)
MTLEANVEPQEVSPPLRKSMAFVRFSIVSPMPACTSRPFGVFHSSKVWTTLATAEAEAGRRRNRYCSITSVFFTSTPSQDQPFRGVMKKSSKTSNCNPPFGSTRRLSRKSPMHRTRSSATLSSRSGVRSSNAKSVPRWREISCSSHAMRNLCCGRRQLEQRTTVLFVPAARMSCARRSVRIGDTSQGEVEANLPSVPSSPGPSLRLSIATSFCTHSSFACGPLLFANLHACSTLVSLKRNGAPPAASRAPMLRTPSTSTKSTVCGVPASGPSQSFRECTKGIPGVCRCGRLLGGNR